MTVPLQNNFNTPLLITKSFLLWRFTDKDGQTFSNDKRNSSEEVQKKGWFFFKIVKRHNVSTVRLKRDHQL